MHPGAAVSDRVDSSFTLLESSLEAVKVHSIKESTISGRIRRQELISAL